MTEELQRSCCRYGIDATAPLDALGAPSVEIPMDFGIAIDLNALSTSPFAAHHRGLTNSLKGLRWSNTTDFEQRQTAAVTIDGAKSGSKR